MRLKPVSVVSVKPRGVKYCIESHQNPGVRFRVRLAESPAFRSGDGVQRSRRASTVLGKSVAVPSTSVEK